MRKVAVVALCCALLGSTLLAAQKQSPASGKKIEALFKAAEIPFTSSEEEGYVAVITVEEGESDRFPVFIPTPSVTIRMMRSFRSSSFISCSGHCRKTRPFQLPSPSRLLSGMSI